MNLFKKIKNIFRNHASVSIEISPRLKRVIDFYPFAVVLTNYDYLNPTILYSNRKHARLTGFLLENILRQSPKIFQGKNTKQEIKDDMKKCLSESSFWHGNVINYKKDGTEIYINLLIFAITYGTEKYYVALKRKAK